MVRTTFVQWIDKRLPIFSFFRKEYLEYQMAQDVNYFWAFGAIAMGMLGILILTGIALAMHYTPNTDHAFDSVARIMTDVNYGWLLRSLHANGASFFFIAVYIHVFRAMYYGSYKEPRELIWVLGMALLTMMIATAFLGYVLPWGQMSFWAATVITNIFTAVPLIGESLVTWIWGGFSVDNPTLNRFFALHYLMPFLILGFIVLHVAAVHVSGSNNPDGVPKKQTVSFHPYVTVKDLFAFTLFFIVYLIFVFFFPNVLGHPDNFIPADPLVTPAHIVPEWYFLPFYSILRAIPDKFGGVVALLGAIGVLFVIPWLDTSKIRSCRYRPLYQKFLLVWILNCFLLGFAGAQPAEGLWLWIARLGTGYYFAHFLIVMPLLGKLEKPKPFPPELSTAAEEAR